MNWEGEETSKLAQLAGKVILTSTFILNLAGCSESYYSGRVSESRVFVSSLRYYSHPVIMTPPRQYYRPIFNNPGYNFNGPSFHQPGNFNRNFHQPRNFHHRPGFSRPNFGRPSFDHSRR